jgi:hypothetical protein
MKAKLIAHNIEQWFDEQNLALETFVSIILNAVPVQSSLENKQSGSL